jgi:hypothetical protein
VRYTEPTTGPDGSLLLYCLGIPRNAWASQPGPALTDADVRELLRQAADNGISALLYQRLMTLAPALALPTGALEHLRDVAVCSAAQSLQITRELAEILTLFRRQDIPVIVLKGAHLGHVVYRNMALRTMGDLDLMVRRHHLAEAERLLGGLGYVPQYDPLLQVDYTRHQHTRPLGKPGASRIDVHWSIARPTAPFHVDLEGVWTRARPARIAGVEALVLSPEDLLLHLCLHTSFDHQFRLGLRASWDIHEVVRHHHDEIDWDQLVRRAREWGIARYVHVTLRLVRDMLGADIPPAPLASLEPPDFPPVVVDWARRAIFTPEQSDSLSPSMGRLWTSRRLGVKASVLLQSMMPSRLAMARIYRLPPGSPRIYLYYPLRWFDLLARYRRYAWGLWRGDHRALRELQAVSERVALDEWLA